MMLPVAIVTIKYRVELWIIFLIDMMRGINVVMSLRGVCIGFWSIC
jgi:hypothetical protein